MHLWPTPLNDRDHIKMAMISEPVETDMASRILVVAERLFRDIGYQKTTVADIAKQLRMSPANVYRFFDSKKSINAAVANRLMREVEDAAQAIVDSRAPAPQRLRKLLQLIHVMNAERYVGDAKLHEMVAVAMEENWDVCSAHMERITVMVGTVIGQGVSRDEFVAPDVPLASMCVCTGMIRFFHPQMIAQCAGHPGPTVEQMIEFVVSALMPASAK
jgi:AcrR family transcriptional regulator